LSRRIVDENQVVAVENLNVADMLKNRKLARVIADCGWSEFVSMLRYKCEWYGSEFLQCGRFEPSSKMCSACGETVPILPLSVREWVCPECGVLHDRDVNAAVNILKFAVAGTVNGRGGDVRRANSERYTLVFAHADSFETSSPGL
jgi:putative transposase